MPEQERAGRRLLQEKENKETLQPDHIQMVWCNNIFGGFVTWLQKKEKDQRKKI